MKENLHWLRGPVAHTHVRYPGEVNRPSSGEYYQFDHLSAVRYLEQLSGTDLRIIDTPHALFAFDDLDNLKRPDSVDMNTWQRELIIKASQTTLERVGQVKQLSGDRVVIGVEADIVDEHGKLSLSDECLGQIDVPIASFHSFIWRMFTEKKRFTVDEFIGRYIGAIENPHVRVLGHAARISSRMDGQISSEHYSPLIKSMSERGTAYEVNILQDDLRSPEQQLNREVIRMCHDQGTPLILSTDFHDFGSVDFLTDCAVTDEITELNVENVFQAHGSVHYRTLRRLIRNVDVLKALGVEQEEIINSSNQNFDKWLALVK